MNNRKPKNSQYPYDNDESTDNKQIRQTELYKPQIKKDSKREFDKDLKIFEKINKKIEKYLKPKPINPTEDEKKKKIGIAITTLIIVVLITSCYYFLIYAPSQESLESAKIEKINELHGIYKGPLASASQSFTLEKRIENSKSPSEVRSINIIGPGTKDWREFQKKSINENKDKFNRTMAVYESEENKTVLMPTSEALKIVDTKGLSVISNIEFKKPDTITVPILISRLQAGAGLVSVGNVIDIYTQNTINNTANPENITAPTISGCTVISIMRCEESGQIESEYGTSQTLVTGNKTNPNENTKTFTANVIEMIKGSLAGGYNEKQTIKMLQDYGVKLANCEREINLAELDAQYLLLIEVPHDNVNYVINNMDNLILTIPTTEAPNWMVNQLTKTYN